MKAAELSQSLLELDPKAEVLFTKRNDSPYIYLISALPDGTKVAAEMPTAVEKSQGEINERSTDSN